MVLDHATVISFPPHVVISLYIRDNRMLWKRELIGLIGFVAIQSLTSNILLEIGSHIVRCTRAIIIAMLIM